MSQGKRVGVYYGMDENNNAYQRAGKRSEKCKDRSNQNVENSSGRSGMLG